jgi:hypothetical protein
MAIDHMEAPAADKQQVVEEQLFCALSGKPLNAAEAYWAPPLVTARELIGTIARTAVRSPALLGHVLFDEQPNVPYAPDMREQLAARRSAEQVKLLAGMLALIALIIVPIAFVALR